MLPFKPTKFIVSILVLLYFWFNYENLINMYITEKTMKKCTAKIFVEKYTVQGR